MLYYLEEEKEMDYIDNDIEVLKIPAPTFKPRRQTFAPVKTEWRCYILVTRVNTPKIMNTKLN